MKQIFKLILGLIIISLILSFWFSYKITFKITFGFFYLFFLPGFLLFSKKTGPTATGNKDGIDNIEKFCLSFALSLSILAISVFFFSLIGVKITLFNVILIITGFLLFLIGFKRKKLSFSAIEGEICGKFN